MIDSEQKSHKREERAGKYQTVFGIVKSIGLEASSEAMEQNIGKSIRLKPDLWEEKYGTDKRDHTFQIISVQSSHNGKLVYRAVNNTFEDAFGTLFKPEEIDFV